MNKYSFSLRRLIPVTMVLITMNTILGIVPSVIFPNLSQPVQAQESNLDITEVGLIQLSQGNYQAAIQNFTKAIRLESNNPENYLLRGLSYFFLENFEKAKEDFNYAIRISPYNSTAYGLRGMNSMFLGVNETKKDLEKAMTLLQQQGDFAKAKELGSSLKELEDSLKEVKEGVKSQMGMFQN